MSAAEAPPPGDCGAGHGEKLWHGCPVCLLKKKSFFLKGGLFNTVFHILQERKGYLILFWFLYQQKNYNFS